MFILCYVFGSFILGTGSGQVCSRYPRSSLIKSKARWYPSSIASIEMLGGGRGAVVRRTNDASEGEALLAKNLLGNIGSGQPGLQGSCPRNLLISAKIAANGRPPFSPPNVSKPPSLGSTRVIPSSSRCPSGLLLEPPTIVQPLAGFSKSGVSGSKAPKTEGMRETLGVTPIFFPKKGDLWKRFGGEVEKMEEKEGEEKEEKEEKEEEEIERLGFGPQMALSRERESGIVGAAVVVAVVVAGVGSVKREEESLADSRILVIESPMLAMARRVLSPLSTVGS